MPAADRPAPREAAGGSWARIYAVVRRIPRGRVATYGQVAELAGLPGQARLVGYALAGLADHGRVPWHRVVNAEGRVSARGSGPGGTVLQRLQLEAEGVVFGAGGRLSLTRYRWGPDGGEVRSARGEEDREGEGHQRRDETGEVEGD